MQIEEAIEYLKMRSEKYKSHKEQIDLVTDIYGTENIKEYHKKQEAIDTLLNYIEIMHKELDRLECIEDNTAMLKHELEKKDKQLQEKQNIINKLSRECQKNFDLAMETEIERITANKVIDKIKFINNTNKPHKAQAKTKECIKQYFSNKED